MDPEYVTITVRYNRPGDPRGPVEGTKQCRLAATVLEDACENVVRDAENIVRELFSKITDRRKS